VKHYVTEDKKMRTWDQQEEYIKEQGGEMYTLTEIKEVYKEYGSTYMFPKLDIWVAVKDEENDRKDWFSLGEKGQTMYDHLGCSHWEKFKKYPVWGDDGDVDGEHMIAVIYRKASPAKEFVFPCEYIWSLREINLSQVVVIYRKENSKKDHILLWDGVSEVGEYET